MDIRALQNTLNQYHLATPALDADGIAGKKTMEAVDNLLKNSPAQGWMNWSDERRRVAAEQIVYSDAGIEVGNIDGLVGEQTRYARTVWEARQKNGGKPDPSVEQWRDGQKDESPKTAPVAGAPQWPKQNAVQSFYGKPGTGMVMLELPFPLRIAWEPEKTIQKVSCHGKCKEAFAGVWRDTLLHYGYEQLKVLRLDMFGGCLNVRKMRGGSSWSMHAFGCAWDVDPDRNQLKFHRAQATLDDAPYEPFWQIVEKHGGLSLGRNKDYDWMHFQFTRDFS